MLGRRITFVIDSLPQLRLGFRLSVGSVGQCLLCFPLKPLCFLAPRPAFFFQFPDDLLVFSASFFEAIRRNFNISLSVLQIILILSQFLPIALEILSSGRFGPTGKFFTENS